MKTFLMTLLALIVVASPYALVCIGVYLLWGIGWSLIVLGLLLLVTVAVVGTVVARSQ